MGEPQHEVRSGDRSGGRGGWIEMQSIYAGNQGSPHLCACRIQGREVQKPITALAGPLHRHRLLAAGHRHKERSQTVRQLRLAYICLCGRGRAGSEPSSVQRKEAATEHYCGCSKFDVARQEYTMLFGSATTYIPIDATDVGAERPRFPQFATPTQISVAKSPAPGSRYNTPYPGVPEFIAYSHN